MDEEQRAWLEGTISAHSFILQNICAMLIAESDDPRANCAALADEMLRQFRLPVTNRGPMDTDKKLAAIKHGEAHLQRFWELVQARIDQEFG